MNQLTRLITNTIGFIRVFFIYLIPALPSSLLFIYFFINWIKSFIFDLKDFMSPTLLIIVLMLIIYAIGRFLYLIGFYLVDFYDLLFKWIPFKINKDNKNINEKIKRYVNKKSINKFGINFSTDELELYHEMKIFSFDPQIFQVYLEQYNLFMGYDRTVSAGFFILMLLLLIFKLKSVSLLFPIAFFILSVLFYFDWVSKLYYYERNSLLASIFIDNNPQKYSIEVTLKNDQENDNDE